MQSIKEQSLIDSAERIIREKKTPMDLYELFNVVCAEKEYSEKIKKERITQFYTDLITSAKFVYTGDNTWDLKEFQKTDLREKDGSYYKEYTVIKALDDEPKKPVKAKTKRKAKAKVKAKVKPVVEEVKVEEIIEEVIEEVVEEVKVKEVIEEVNDIKTPKSVEEDQVKEYEEEVFEEFEDEFDEEKYNEYMDTYEDKYDEK